MDQIGVAKELNHNCNQRCPDCKKGLRAALYCKREICGLRYQSPIAAKSGSTSPEYARFNDALEHCKLEAVWMQELSEQAYAVANSLSSPGPKLKLLEIAETAARFAALVRTAKSL